MDKLRATAISAGCILVILLLAGCVPSAFNPEAAAVQAVSENDQGFIVDQQSIQVTQSVQFDDFAIVQVRFKGTRVNSGIQSCLGVYGVRKSTFGTWTSQNSGVGCAAQRPPTEEMPISSGQSWFSENQRENHPGYTIGNGEVFDEAIINLLITWDDGKTETAAVVNQAYMSVREGKFNMRKLEALNGDDQVVFTYDVNFGAAPGKFDN